VFKLGFWGTSMDGKLGELVDLISEDNSEIGICQLPLQKKR